MPDNTASARLLIFALAGVALVVALAAVLVVHSGGTTGKTSGHHPNASRAEHVTAATSTTTTAPIAVLGQAAVDDSDTFVVHDIQCGLNVIPPGSADPNAAIAPDGTQWCLVDMSVTNNGTTPTDYSSENQIALDSHNRELTSDGSGILAAALPNWADDYSTFNPGVTKDISIVFQVATGDQIVGLRLYASANSNGVLVRNA